MAQDNDPPAIKVIAFDGFPIFDPRPIAAASEEVFPGNGKAFMSVWRSRIFEYQWLRALAGQYEDFMSATEAGLVFAAKQMDLELTDEKKKKLLNQFENLKVWPDVPGAVRELRELGVELVFLSNMTDAMLRGGLKSAGLENEFKAIYSTDIVKSYKPAPEAYALAVEKLGVRKDEVLFVAFAGWDVAGAKWYGYPTFWVNRLNAPGEELGAIPDGAGTDLSGLVKYVARRNGKL